MWSAFYDRCQLRERLEEKPLMGSFWKNNDVIGVDVGGIIHRIYRLSLSESVFVWCTGHEDGSERKICCDLCETCTETQEPLPVF